MKKDSASEGPIKLLIVEDNSDYRKDLADSLNRVLDMEVVGDFSSYTAAEEAFERKEYPLPDLILLDIQIPGVSGIEAIPKIQEAFPPIGIVMLTTFSDKRNVFDAICAGATGYLLKTDGIMEITRAIRIVNSGGASLSGSIAHMVVEVFSAIPPQQTDHDLEELELNILKLLSEGNQKKEIAEQLEIEDHQLHYCMRKIYKKLQVHSLSGAVGIALRKGLIK